MKIVYDGTIILKKTSYKYLGFRIDGKLSFRHLISDQMIKLRRTYMILKHIHQQFPSFFTLKKRVFNTYAWLHIYMISTIYCLLSKTGQDRINGIYRHRLRIIYCLYQCTNAVSHETFNLPTLDTKFKKCLMKRLNSIQLYEPELISCYLLRKNVTKYRLLSLQRKSVYLLATKRKMKQKAWCDV